MSSEKQSGHILVVDDNEMNRDMLTRRLQRQGYEVDVAEDGEKALSTMQACPYDLVLLDIMMPGLNGYEVLERAKNDANLRSVPIIMISAVDDLDSVVRCIELGAEDYLFKPFNPVLLKARVSAILSKVRSSVTNPSLPDELIEISQSLVDDAAQLLESGTLQDDERDITHRIYTNAEELKQILQRHTN